MLKLLADENIPGLAHWPGYGLELHSSGGRDIQPALLQDTDILLVRSVTPVNEALLSGSPVRFVGSATSGIDHIDRDYLASRDITFTYAPGSNANSVVEYVLSAIAASGETLERLLEGGNVGIVGYGHVGKALTARLDALGIAHKVYDPWLEQGTIPSSAELKDVLDCDVVSLHPELTLEQPWPSHHLIGPEQLAELRPESLLINASRGPVVDNEALLTLLASGQGPDVVLDVWEHEPVISPALLERVTLGTPHIAGYSLDAKLRATGMLEEAVMAFMERPSQVSAASPCSRPPIELGQPVSRADLLRVLLEARYSIREDDTRLRQVVSDRTGKGFDQLRRTYRERRELAGSRVTCEPEFGPLVAAMGCTPVATGGAG